MHSGKFLLAGLAILAGSGWESLAAASDLELKPNLSVSEEYNDNLFQSATNRRSEFTTRLRPGALLSYRTSSFTLDTAYTFDYRNYARGSHEDQMLNDLDLRVNAKLIDNFFYLDIRDALHQVTANVARDVATEGLLVQQTSQNIATISPYLLWHPSEKGTLKTGYRYSDTRYWEGVGIDKREHGAFADFVHRLSARLNLTAGYAFTSGDAAFTRYDRHDLSAGFRYSYADNSSVFGSIGNSWQSFSGGSRTSNLFWNAGVSHGFGGTVALLETKVVNAEDPLSVATRQVSYSGRIDKMFERGAIGFGGSYAEYTITQTGRLEQRRETVSANGRYEFLPRLYALASASLDHFSRATSTDYPYRLTGSGGFSYGFHNNDTVLALTYTYLTDRYAIDSATEDKVTNRVLLEIRTVF